MKQMPPRRDLSMYPSVPGFDKSLDGQCFDLVSPRKIPRASAQSAYPTVPGFDRTAHGESFDLSQDTLVVPVLDASGR